MVPIYSLDSVSHHYHTLTQTEEVTGFPNEWKKNTRLIYSKIGILTLSHKPD